MVWKPRLTNYYLRVNLLVTKGSDPKSRAEAEREILDRLNAWFRERLIPPFPPGTLVHYTILPGVTAVPVEDDDSHGIESSKTV